MTRFYTFPIVNKSRKKTTSYDVLTHSSHSVSYALVPTEDRYSGVKETTSQNFCLAFVSNVVLSFFMMMNRSLVD